MDIQNVAMAYSHSRQLYEFPAVLHEAAGAAVQLTALIAEGWSERSDVRDFDM